MKKLTYLLAGAFLAPTLAISGGMERTALPTSFMFETGGYADFTYSNRNYDVTDNFFAPTSSMYGDVSGASISVKFDVNETIAVGLTQYNQAGINLNYQGAGSQIPGFNAVGPMVDLEIDALAVMGKYSVGDNFSVLGGIKRSSIADATADIFKLSVPGVTTAAAVTGDSETGYVAGVAYERKDIALRIEYVVEQDVDFSLSTTGGALGAATANTTGSIPDYQTINFQSGVAEDTLIFGSIRKADWSNHQIAVAPQTQAAPTSSFSDSTTYSIGLGRRISDELSVSASYSFEDASEATGTSLLSTTDGYDTIGLGVRYTLSSGTEISGGVALTEVGDKTVTASEIPGAFTDNSVTSYGIKLAYKF
jgi:long-subunit fatty acid transport protein